MQQPFNAEQADQVLRWNGAGDGSNYVDVGSRNLNSYGMMPAQNQFSQGVPAPSTALARRGMNQALVPTGARTTFNNPSEPWNNFTEDASYLQPSSAPADEHDTVERLEELAQRAKRDAQAKRKQIPPFVQKLSRYVFCETISLSASVGLLTRAQLPRPRP